MSNEDKARMDKMENSYQSKIELYLEVLKEDGKPIPKPSTKVGQVAVNI